MFSLALKFILRRIDRTIVTILIIVPVIALLVGSNILISGYVQETQDAINLVQPSTTQYLALQSGSKSTFSSKLDFSTFNEINSSASVSWALPFLVLNSLVSFQNRSLATYVLGTHLNLFAKIKHSMVYGNISESSSQVDLGAIAARILKINIGDQIQITSLSKISTFTVDGILNSTDQSDTDVLMPIYTEWNTWPQTANTISFAEFAVPKGSMVTLPQNMMIIQEQSLTQVVHVFSSQISGLLEIWSYLLLALSAVVSIAGMFRVVSGTTQDYATLRILGAKLGVARRLILDQVLIISIISTIIGVAAGIVATEILSTFARSILSMPITPNIDLTQLSLIGSISFVLVFLVGVTFVFRLPREFGQQQLS